MNSTIINESVIAKLLEDFRYDLIKVIAFILLFTAAIIFANAESEKYYPLNQNKTLIINK
ncbi:MAG TPA: hypothetical protein VJ455_12140 [Ignavibacteria bacterium]|nr:hypothetical protein [Ignavibacteria bacterium]